MMFSPCNKKHLAAALLVGSILCYIWSMSTTSKNHWFLEVHGEAGGIGDTKSDLFMLGRKEYLRVCPHQEYLSQVPVFPEFKVFQKKLMEYAHFHHQQLEFMKDGIIPPSKVRTLIWSCPEGAYCAGLGDQLFRIETAFLLALVSGRVFGIHWNEVTMRTMKYLEPHSIRWDQVRENVGETAGLLGKVRTKKGNTLLAKYLYSTNLTDNHITLTMETVVSMPEAIGFLCDGDSSTIGLFNKIGLLQDSTTVKFTALINVVKYVILHYLFSFSQQVITKVDQLQKNNGLTKPYVGIHLRTGFTGNKFEEIIARPEHATKEVQDKRLWKSTLDCSVRLADSMLGEDSMLYLATDSYMVKKAANKMYPGRIITLDIELEHFGMLSIESNMFLRKKYHMRFDNISLTASSVDSFKGIDGKMGMWVDFLMLARSHAMVRATSGFSATASDFCLFFENKMFLTPNCTNQAS